MRPLSDQSTLFCLQVNTGVNFISNDVYEGNPVVAPRHWLLKFVHFTPYNCREALCVYQWSKYTWGTFRLSSTHICKLAWKKMENIYRVGIYYLTRAMCKKYVNKINSAFKDGKFELRLTMAYNVWRKYLTYNKNIPSINKTPGILFGQTNTQTIFFFNWKTIPGSKHSLM